MLIRKVALGSQSAVGIPDKAFESSTFCTYVCACHD